MRWLTTYLLCVAALMIGGCAGIQASPAPAGPAPAEITTEQLLQYTVVSRDGEAFGPVHGVAVDLKTGTVNYVVVRLPDRYHFGKGAYGPPNDRFLLIPWSHLELDAADQVLVTDVAGAVLAQAPTLDHVPSTAQPDWDDDLVRFWAAR